MSDTDNSATTVMSHTSAADASQESATDGLLSGRYRILGRLGEGGMGQVFEAEHVLMKKKVALKVLHGELTKNKEMVARFQREAQAAAALQSPYVCQATDFGQTDDGAFFLVMEHLEGQTLEEVIATFGRLSATRALHITRQIALALKEAHTQGIVHRDLKPENVMLIDRNGDADTVKIMDFGIARILDGAGLGATEDGEDNSGATRLTRQGMIFGTPQYMSPEQVSGDEIDHRTDLYSLGVVLFEMLTGRVLFEGDNIARVMGQHVTKPPPTLAERCPEERFSAALQDLVSALLAKVPGERPQTAAATIELIDKAVASLNESGPSLSGPSIAGLQTVTTAAISTSEKAVTSFSDQLIKGMETGWMLWNKFPRQHRLLLAAAGACMMALLAATIILVALLMSDDRQVRIIEDQRQSILDDPEVVAAMAALDEGDRSALASLLEARPDDAALRHLVFTTEIEAGRSVAVVEEAQKILALDRRYANDEVLMTELVSRLHTNSDGEAARELLKEHMTSAARKALSEQARTGSNRARRDPSYELLKEHNQLRYLDEWERLSVELRQTSGCPELKEKIAAIVATGESAAVSSLEAFQDTPRRGCGPLRQRDCISCIRQDLADAIETLGGGG